MTLREMFDSALSTRAAGLEVYFAARRREYIEAREAEWDALWMAGGRAAWAAGNRAHWGIRALRGAP